jgi:hypothetical protein
MRTEVIDRVYALADAEHRDAPARDLNGHAARFGETFDRT